MARANGCTLQEGFTKPCVVDGKDRGEEPYEAFVMGWFMLLSLPVALIFAIALVVIVMRDVIAKRRT